MPTNSAVATFASICCLVAAGSALAADGRGFALERFEPSPVPGFDILDVFTAPMPSAGSPSAAVTFHYSDAPFTLVRVGDGRVVDIVDHQFSADVAFGVALLDHVTLSAALPVALARDGDDLARVGRPGETLSGAALGDVRVVPRVRLWYPEDAGGFGVVLASPVYLPTGDEDRLTSDGQVRARPTVGFDYRDSAGFTVALNVGYHARPDRTLRDHVSTPSVTLGAAAHVPTGWSKLAIVGAVTADVPVRDNQRDPVDLGVDADGRSIPVELLVGAELRHRDLVVHLALGGGLGSAVGAPDLRAALTVAWAPTGPGRDRDGDGIPDRLDPCPDAPEDVDGFEDADGCPDPDNDGDGIPDRRDGCPDTREDLDGFEDEDGCPDPDNDGDGLCDPWVAAGGQSERYAGVCAGVDQCPDAPEDVDGFEDEDGCPDPDNDGDGVCDPWVAEQGRLGAFAHVCAGVDQCPDAPEDVDGFEDADGCPDPDNDGDGIYDVNDACPDLPETFNGFEDADGCPDSDDGRVRVVHTDILIERRIHFTRDGTTLEPRSFPVLDTVADIILSNADITLIQIEGHTDDLGDPERNLTFSQARADAVLAYLIRRGVNPEILIAKGFGADWPVDPDDTPVARAQNRRVEFRILEIAGRPVAPRPPPEPGDGTGAEPDDEPDAAPTR